MALRVVLSARSVGGVRSIAGGTCVLLCCQLDRSYELEVRQRDTEYSRAFPGAGAKS
jgi:hypothetical protein